MEDDGKLYVDTEHSDHLIEKFILNRLKLIKENKYPIQLSSETPSRYLMHIIPTDYKKITLDIKQLDLEENYFLPHGPSENYYVVPEYNFDGIFFSTSVHEKRGYTQVFRDGRVETVIATGKYDIHSGNTLSLFRIQLNTVFRLTSYLTLFKKFSISGPYTVYFRMIGMKDIKLSPEDIQQSGYDSKAHIRSLTRDELIFPHLVLASWDVNIKEAVKPLFDIYWNTFGFQGTPSVP